MLCYGVFEPENFGVKPTQFIIFASISQEFPPRSKLDREEFGNQDSSITREHIETNMNGLTVEEVINTHTHTLSLLPFWEREKK